MYEALLAKSDLVTLIFMMVRIDSVCVCVCVCECVCVCVCE
jgi:hypothetical protein